MAGLTVLDLDEAKLAGRAQARKWLDAIRREFYAPVIEAGAAMALTGQGLSDAEARRKAQEFVLSGGKSNGTNG